MSEKSILTTLRSYTESASENTTFKNLLKTNTRKLNGKLTMISLFHKMNYTHLQGKRNFVDTDLTFLSYILILTQLILMKFTHRDQILSLSLAPIFMIQVIVKIGKLDPLLTDPQYNLQMLNRKVKVKMLRPPQTYFIMIIPHNHLSQIQTLKLHMNLCNNHHRGREATLQSLRSTILLSKLFRKTNLEFLEEANTTYALILILITQINTDTDVSKLSFSAPSLCNLHSLIFILSILFQHIFLFCFGGKFK